MKLTLNILMAVAVTAMFSSCSSDHSHDTKTVTETVEKAADKVADHADDHAHGDHDGHDHADHATESVDKMEGKDAGVDFAEGSWGHGILDYMDSGSGSKTFDLDKITQDKGEDLTPEADQQLDDLAALLKSHPDMTCELQAHSKEAKNAVGKKTKKAGTSIRAEWVKLKLKAKGVEGKQINAKGYGDESLMSGVAGDDDSQRRLTVMFTK